MRKRILFIFRLDRLGRFSYFIIMEKEREREIDRQKERQKEEGRVGQREREWDDGGMLKNCFLARRLAGAHTFGFFE